MTLNPKALEQVLNNKGLTVRDLKSVGETTAYKAKNGKSISAKSAKKIADELGVKITRIKGSDE